MNWLRGSSGATFDDDDAFVPEHLPIPGSFLQGHEVLGGEDHVAVHLTAQDLFEEYGVYDVTFGYNLARLNLDQRHPDAGFRYALDAADRSILRAEFTPTTEFCPQADTLTTGAFRAWNRSEAVPYDVVMVRVAESHQSSEATNRRLRELEAEYRETGVLDQ